VDLEGVVVMAARRLQKDWERLNVKGWRAEASDDAGQN